MNLAILGSKNKRRNMKEANDTFTLSKSVWNENDFEQMNWHDNHIHGVAFNPDSFKLLFDIDYIFKWVSPNKGEKYYSFWISLCTIIFHNVHTFKTRIDYGLGLEIDCINREKIGLPKNHEYITKQIEYSWLIECQEGEISFSSVGYDLIIRNKPEIINSQSIDMEKRGGVSFSEIPYDAKDAFRRKII